MKNSTLLLTALATPALLSFSHRADVVKFAPEAGTSVTKTFTSTSDFTLDDMSMLMNGEPNPMMPEIDMQMTMTQTVEVTDTYDAVKDGQPTKLTRTFGTLSNEMEMEMSVDMMGETQDENANGSGGSELEGQTVVFTFDEEGGEYTASFPEGEEGDAELLENLVENMDLRGLIPSGDVSEGDTYDLELAGLIDIFAPGGDLKIDLEMEGVEAGMGPDPAMMADFRKVLEDMLEGEATGKYLGTRDVDGVKVGVIELNMAINASRDMSDMVSEMMGEEIPEGMDMSIDRMDVEFSYEGGGEMLWNVESGHIHGMDLTGDAEINLDMEMSVDMGGQAMGFSMEMAMSGTIENVIETE